MIAQSDSNQTDFKLVIRAILLLTAIFCTGFAVVAFLGGTIGISRYFYGIVDLPGFAAVIIVAIVLAFGCVVPGAQTNLSRLSIGFISPALVAAISLGVSILFTHLAYHSYAFSMDEWMTRLQAEIFLSGRVAAVVPEEWRPFGRAMYQGFASYDPNTGQLASNYRPGMSLLYAGFSLFGLGLYTSAILNGAAILLIARVAKQIFPESAEAPIVAALLLATSQQAFANSLTSYAMTAHLCFNLAWLTLFLENRWRCHVLAALIGVATAALHQIHFHLFFALPFLITLLKPFRPGLVLMYGIVYVAGHLAVLSWDWFSFNGVVSAASAVGPSAQPPVAPDLLARLTSMARFPNHENLASVAANIVRLIAWQSIALVPLFMVSFRKWRQNRTLVLLLWSLFFSALPYPFLMPDQGHGWGYRYLHGLLGHLALLAIPGWTLLRGQAKQTSFLSWVTACLLLSPFIMIPFRAYQIESIVGPYSRATDMVRQSEADITLINNYEVALGNDIPRNSPIAPTSPISMNDWQLSPDQLVELCRNYSVLVIEPEAYSAIGVHILSEVPKDARSRYNERNEAIKGCHS